MGNNFFESNVRLLLRRGVGIKEIIEVLPRDAIVEHLDFFIRHPEVDIDLIVPELYPEDIAKNLNILLAHGASINVNELVLRLDPTDIVWWLDLLIAHGAKIDINKLVPRLDHEDVADKLNTLIAHGANIDLIIQELHQEDIIKNIDTLMAHGVSIDSILYELLPECTIRNLDVLMAYGAEIDIDEIKSLISELSRWQVLEYLGTLRAYAMSRPEPKSAWQQIREIVDPMIDTVIDVDLVARNLYLDDVIDNLDALLDHGADFDYIISRIPPRMIDDEVLSMLVDNHADVKKLIELVGIKRVFEKYDFSSCVTTDEVVEAFK